MRTILLSLLVVFLTSAALGEAPDPPLEETRLTVSALVREDVFAGWMEDDMDRFARAEANLELLLEQRPKSQAEVLAWQAGARIYRAVLAHEAGEADEFERLFGETRDLFAAARKADPHAGVVYAIIGGAYALFTDRIPEEFHEACWEESYGAYQTLWSEQGRIIDKLPLHIGGELLAGLAQGAQRTGREKELGEHLDKILEVYPDSQYAGVAEEWKEDPLAAAGENITCKYCHDPGKLESRLTRLRERDARSKK